MTNELSKLILKTIWLTFQFIVAISITFLGVSVIPLAVIFLVGALGLLSIALGGVIVFLHSPTITAMILIVVAFICGIATIVIAIILTLVFAMTMSFISLFVSLIINTIFNNKGIKSWLIHLVAYSFSGTLTGIPFSMLGLALTWGLTQIFQQIQPYSTPIMLSLIALCIVAGIFSVNVSGITMGTMTKIRDFLLKLRST